MSAPLIIAVILGLIQGVCEFLPVSSSGHLVIFQAFFGLEEPEIAFDVVLHLGTLVAVFIFYRETIWILVRELKYLPGALISPSRMKTLYQERPDFRFGLFVLAASLPTGLIGLLFKSWFDQVFGSVMLVGVALIFTGILLTVSARKNTDPAAGRGAGEMTLKDALIIGLVQGLAITPGLSRSGFTISAGLLLGLNRELAARFSFILSIPAILGALVLELRHGLPDSDFGPSAFAAGFLVAMVSGYLALSLLVKLLKKNLFGLFAYWCWAMGIIAIGASMIGLV